MVTPDDSLPFPTSDASSQRSSSPLGSTGHHAASPTVERVVQGAHDAVDRVAAKAAPAVEKLRVGAAEARDSLRHSADRMMELEREWVESCRTCVREHPLASVAVAVAAGMILSRLLGERRS